MAIGTRGDIDTDIDIGAFSRYEEYEDDNGTHILTIEKRVHTTEYSKGVYVDKEYVSLESNAEITKPILDKMDTVKKVRFIGPIIWFWQISLRINKGSNNICCYLLVCSRI
ncbi:MAG: hypothetical protein ACLRZ2_00165 [Veillonella sp.]